MYSFDYLEGKAKLLLTPYVKEQQDSTI